MRSAPPAGYNQPMRGSKPVNPASSGVKLTYDDFVLLPDDGKRHEIIEGQHYVTPSPNTKHQRVSLNLIFCRASRCGWLGSFGISPLCESKRRIFSHETTSLQQPVNLVHRGVEL
jgi:hypothetical protein